MQLPKPPDRIAGKYELQGIIGQGGFATVFEAVDLTVDREVAVKVLKPGADGYEVTLARRFKREAELVSTLSDPHTVQMFDYGRTDDGLLYMVFERLSGEDLSTRLIRKGVMSPPDVERVVRQVLASLREAHGHGLLHRDIKPANIRLFRYMDDPLRVKVMDFGIARDAGGAGRVTRTGAIVGTPRYMSPEQFTGEQLTAASDLFSVGLVAFEMLTATPAPRQDIILGKPVSAPVGGRLGRLIEELLWANADERVQTVDEAIAILDGDEDVEATTKMRARPAPVLIEEGPTHELTPGRGRREWALPAAIVFAGLIAAAVLIARSMGDEPAPRPAGQIPVKPVSPGPDVARFATPSPDASRPDSSTPAMTTTGCGREDYPGADGDRSIKLDSMTGLERRKYAVLLPERYDPSERYGLVLGFHDAGSSQNRLRRGAKLRDAADEHDVIIALPMSDALIPWERSGTAAMARGILADMLETYCIDEDRIYVIGSGKGGIAAERLSCEPWLTASVSMGFRKAKQEFECEPASPTPYLHLAPMKSGHLPLEGGQDCVWESDSISLKDHDARWRERNECSGEPKITRHKKSKCYRWACAAPFESCHVDGGMPWPGLGPREIDVLRCDGLATEFAVHEKMWAFFDRATTWKRKR